MTTKRSNSHRRSFLCLQFWNSTSFVMTMRMISSPIPAGFALHHGSSSDITLTTRLASSQMLLMRLTANEKKKKEFKASTKSTPPDGGKGKQMWTESRGIEALLGAI